ncbi:CAP domain-containing protein [Patescibacteria group bacterium]
MRAYPQEDSGDIKKYRFIYHFIPHKQHKKRARLLSHGALISYSLVLVAFAGLIKFLPLYAPGVLGYASDVEVSALLRYTNERRASIGLKPLSLNKELSEAAFNKANHMFSAGYWAHVSPGGTKPWDFVLSEGYDYIYAGENLAKNFSNSKDVVQAWYDSPTHRDNLLSSNYDDIGFAVVNGVLDGYETTIVVQMFGRLREPVLLASDNAISEGYPSTNIDVAKDPVEKASEEAEAVLNEIEKAEQIREEVILAELQGSESLANVQVERPFVDVKAVTQSITIAFGGFITTLLGIDVWYSKKHGIFKLTGHTLAHLALLLVAIASVMLSVFPGVVL